MCSICFFLDERRTVRALCKILVRDTDASFFCLSISLIWKTLVLDENSHHLHVGLKKWRVAYKKKVIAKELAVKRSHKTRQNTLFLQKSVFGTIANDLK